MGDDRKSLAELFAESKHLFEQATKINERLANLQARIESIVFLGASRDSTKPDSATDPCC